MKPGSPKSSGRTIRWLALGLAIALAGLLAAVTWRTRLVRQGLPPQPALASAAAALADEVTAAEKSARAWGWNTVGLERLAGLYHANGFFPEAEACYRLLARLHPRDARWPHLLANLAASFGRGDEALTWQREAARLAPDNFIVQLRLGDLLLKANAVADAEQAYTRALQLAPDNPYVLLGLARCALRRDDWAAARTQLEKAVAAQPAFAAAWALLASVETHLGNPAAAMPARQRGNAQFRELTDPWLSFLSDLCYDPYQLSVAAAVSPDPAQARALLERAIALAPDTAAYHRQLAKLLIAARDNAAARSQLEKAVQLAPEDAEAWSALIELLIATGDGRAAIAALAEALRHCPQSGFLHLTNGRRLAAVGQLAAAESELKLSIQLQPTEVRGYLELSTLYVRAGRIPEAVAVVQGAHAVNPADITVMGLLAQLAIMQHDEAGATGWAKKIAASPGDESDTLNRIRAAFQQQFGRALTW